MKNIIFDVGNVLITWDPINIMQQAFPESARPQDYLTSFKEVIANDLDTGMIDFATANKKLQKHFNVPKERIDNLFSILLSSLTPLPANIELLSELANDPAYSLYCLTNMSTECFIYLNQQYNFWDKFKGIVVSADIKLIKPDPKIYSYTLEKFNLLPEETVFIDDLLENIIAARKMGIFGIHFTDLAACKNELRKLKINVS